KKLIIQTDNLKAEGVVCQHISKDRSVNQEWKITQNLLTCFQFVIKERVIMSNLNLAYTLSQADISKESYRKKCYISLYQKT
ncbi:hypothetical protein CROQUDRAFT_42697, partial [Cronartium quercuum f. sp. fusiforme G11]